MAKGRWKRFWTWLRGPLAPTVAATASTAAVADTTIVTATAQNAHAATYEITVASVASDHYFVQYELATLPPAGALIEVIVGPDLANPDAVIGPVPVTADRVALAAALNAAQPADHQRFDASTDGNTLSLRARDLGSAGQLALRPQGGPPFSPVAPPVAPDAVVLVNQVAVPAIGNTVTLTPGVTITALKPGTTRVVVGSGSPAGRMPGFIFVTALLYIVVIAVFGLQYPHISIRLLWLHNKHHVAHLISWHVPHQLGQVPAAVPWFGAVGGLLISLEGIFGYNQRWESRFNYWHILRPIVGALAGTMGVFLLLVVINAADATSDANLLKAAATSESRRILFEVVGFVTGYREETFRSLVKRVVDVMLGPGTSPTGAGGAGS